jgi:hypothetical protein
MENILLSLSILFWFQANASDSLTLIQQKVNATGSLNKLEILTLDNIPAFRIDVLKVTDLENFSVTGGLRIVYHLPAGKEQKLMYNYIDAAEIASILTSLQYMKTVLKSNTIPSGYTEIKFTTKSGAQFMLFTGLNPSGKIVWNFSVATDLKYERSLFNLQTDDVAKLLKVFEQAKEKL